MAMKFKAINVLKKRPGFTMIEMIVSLAIAMLAFLMIYRFMSGTRHHFMYGTVNLQNLQEARLAINYLRRDFSSACPKLEDSMVTGNEETQRILKHTFVTPSWPEPGPKGLMQVMPTLLSFYKFEFDPAGGAKPKVQNIKYEFESSENALIRYSEDGRTVKFTGFESVEFGIYTHQLNPSVPILWAKFRIHEGKNIYGSENIGSALELTTSVSSPFITSYANNKSWRFDSGHENF